MQPQQIEQLVEPWIVKLVRRGATWAVGALASYLVARGLSISPDTALAWSVAISTAVGVPLSYVVAWVTAAALARFAR